VVVHSAARVPSIADLRPLRAIDGQFRGPCGNRLGVRQGAVVVMAHRGRRIVAATALVTCEDCGKHWRLGQPR
jgi:hypothetical protein